MISMAETDELRPFPMDRTGIGHEVGVGFECRFCLEKRAHLVSLLGLEPPKVDSSSLSTIEDEGSK